MTVLFRASPDPGWRAAPFRAAPGGPSVLRMTQHIDIEALFAEIRRYLAAVDAFRALGCEPTWHADPSAALGREATCARQ